MLSFLKCILNPYDDVALLSVLRQPYTCSYIDMETIAQIRINNKKASLYETLKQSENRQIQNFLDIFEQLKEYALCHSPYDLILKIDSITDYRLFVSRLINGQQRKANLELFYEPDRL